MRSEMNAEFQQQYAALRNGCGVVSLVDWSSIAVTGSDRQQFLHNFCTNDVKRLQPGDACEAFFLNVKGKILGHGIVSCLENELVIFGEPGQATTIIAHLDCYVIREDVQLRDTTAERSYVLVAGGAETAAVATGIGNADGRILAANRCGLIGSQAECALETLADVRDELISLLEVRGGIVANAAFETARVEAGLPLIGVDYGSDNLPQEVGRDKQAISFTKGCYLGQETVARIDALGHVNQRIVGVRFGGKKLPSVGSELVQNSSVVGRVTSAVFSPQLDAPLALAMVRREANSIGSLLESSCGECEVVALPLLG